MASLANLIPAPSTKNIFVPRPASLLAIDISGTYTSAEQITALLIIGTRAYGMIASASFAGKDQPFCYDIENDVMVTISGQLAANLPTTQSVTGDWQPPKMAEVAGRILVTHTGFSGVTYFFGWIDISGFSITTLTGSTHTSTLIDTLSANPITAGVQPGMTITGTGIPAGTTVVSLAAASITISQATTGSAGAVALSISGGTFAAPKWGAGNTNTHALESVPISVAQYNNRAWYAVDNTVVYSDALNPTEVTNADQALTLGDSQDVTSLAGLPLSNQLGGIIASLIAFKGSAIMYQVTGDRTTSDLASNAMNIATGTQAPNSIAATPLGLGFVAPDGLRLVSFSGAITGVIGANGDGVNVPFINAVTASRMAAAYNQNVYRITVKNGAAAGNPTEEYWYDFSLKGWTGPHSFPASIIAASQNSTLQGFLLAATDIDAKLWSGIATPDVTSTYVENSVALSWIYQTVLLPDTDTMRMNAVNQTTIALALPASQSVTVQALDEQGNSLGSVMVSGSGVAPALWGTGVWGSMVWGSGGAMLAQQLVPWEDPLVFKQMAIRITGASIAEFAIGNLYFEFQKLAYLLQAS